jgi:hypothetical protein
MKRKQKRIWGATRFAIFVSFSRFCEPISCTQRQNSSQFWLVFQNASNNKILVILQFSCTFRVPHFTHIETKLSILSCFKKKMAYEYTTEAKKNKRLGCNTRTSQEVTHPSTTLAQTRLTAEF